VVWLLSVVISDEGSLDVLAGVVVVPDGRGEGEDPVQEAGEDAVFGTSAVSFQVKLGLEGLVDGLDDLAQRLEQFLSRPGSLALADRPEQHQATVRDCLLEVPAEVVLVPDQGLPGAGVHESGVDLQHGEQGLALVGLRPGDREHDGQAVQGADQVEPKAPEVPGVTGAVAVLRPARDVTPLHGLAGAAALDRGGVHDPHVVAPQARVHAQPADDGHEQEDHLSQPLVIPGLADLPGEQAREVRARVPQPAPLRPEAEQGGHDRHGQQFGITDSRHHAAFRPPRRQARLGQEQVVDLDIQCSREGLDVLVHNLIMETLASPCPETLGSPGITHLAAVFTFRTPNR
jgi:hypothetical protein